MFKERYLVVVPNAEMLNIIFELMCSSAGDELEGSAFKHNDGASIYTESFLADIIIERQELRTKGMRVDKYFYFGNNTQFENEFLKILLK